MTAWIVQTRVHKKGSDGQMRSGWELLTYGNSYEFQYPVFRLREEARHWRRRVCPARGLTRIHPVNHIDLIVGTPHGLVTVIRALDPV